MQKLECAHFVGVLRVSRYPLFLPGRDLSVVAASLSPWREPRNT